jgi:ketosteroid isomerase-like protein
LTGFEFDHVLVHGESVATYGRMRARQRDTGRSLCFRFAHFLRFAEGKLIAHRGIADTFDAAEQLVGHSIDVTREMPSAPIVPDDDFSEL